MTRYFFSAEGNYLGGFDGEDALTLVPHDAVEVQDPPAHGFDKLVNGQIISYVAPIPLETQFRALFKQLSVAARIQFSPVESLVYQELKEDQPDFIAIEGYISSIPDEALTADEVVLKNQMLSLLPQ